MDKPILFLCDGKNPNCTPERCYRQGGECKHTLNIEHAINFISLEDINNDGFYVESTKLRFGDANI